MDTETIKNLLVNAFGTPIEYSYLAVSKPINGYADPAGDGSMLIKLYSHSVTSPHSDEVRLTIEYAVVHRLKLIVFKDQITSEIIHG